MSFFASLLVVSLLLVGCFGQTFVPLIPYDGIYNNNTIQQGAFAPNGSLALGGTDTYYVTLGSVPSGYGLSIYVEYMSGPYLQEPAYAMLYLKRGASPSAINYDVSGTADCDAVPCYFLFPPAIGVCGPQSGNWYFSITNNNNQDLSLNYSLNVNIDVYGGDSSLFTCSSSSDAGGFFTTLIIVIFVIVGVVILAIGGGIICCCCCCAAGVAGVAVAASYQPVPDRVPVQVPVYGAAPQYGAPQNPYPPNTNNIQYNPSNNKDNSNKV